MILSSIHNSNTYLHFVNTISLQKQTTLEQGTATIQATNLPTFDENPLNRIIIQLKKPKNTNSKIPVISNIRIKACLRKGEHQCSNALHIIYF